MDDIELLKKKLNSEKVFYNFNWHELVPEDTSNCSGLEGSTSTYSGKTSTKKKKKSSTIHRRKTLKTPPASPNKSIISGKKSPINHSSSSFLEKNEMFGFCTKRYQNPAPTISTNEKCKMLPRKCWTFSFFLHLLKCLNLESKSLPKKETNEYIQEIENIDAATVIDVKPPIDILYNVNRIVLLLFISGILENFKICFDPSTRILTISGYKLPYQEFTEQSFICHEIKQGYFERSFLIKKSVMENAISHIHEQGVIKIDIPFEQENFQNV